MAAGISSDSIIWVAGETTGHNAKGQVVPSPTAASGVVGTIETAAFAQAKAYTDALHTKLTASGIIP